MYELYNTRLSPEQYPKFKVWASEDPDVRNNLYDYDMQGWWLENYLKGKLDSQEQGAHFTDKYKKPNHPTFSVESRYSNDVTPGGSWTGRDGFWSFTPSKWQLQQSNYLPRLRNYFNAEYGRGINEVILPNTRWLTKD